MKIVGFTYLNGTLQMVIKSDSSLLNQRKPFFLPKEEELVLCTPCVAIRISRLGRHIQEKFAERYYDALTWGLDFRKEAFIRQNQLAEGLAFDDSLSIGRWCAPGMQIPEEWTPAISIAKAIEIVSRHMTIRTGDILYIDTQQPAFHPIREQVYTGIIDGQEILYCKMK